MLQIDGIELKKAVTQVLAKKLELYVLGVRPILTFFELTFDVQGGCGKDVIEEIFSN